MSSFGTRKSKLNHTDKVLFFVFQDLLGNEAREAEEENQVSPSFSHILHVFTVSPLVMLGSVEGCM